MLTALFSLSYFLPTSPHTATVSFMLGITLSMANALRADQPLTYCTHTKHINIISHIFGILNISKPYSFASDVYKFIHFRRLTVIEIVIGSISKRRTQKKKKKQTKELYRRLCEGIESHLRLLVCQLPVACLGISIYFTHTFFF